jgi:hypothetical protein
MTDFGGNPPRGAFKGWTRDQIDERIRAAIPIINQMASFGVAVSVNTAELASLAPKTADPGSRVIHGGFRTPYAVCCHAAMVSLVRLSRNADIAYRFESGDKNQGESQSFIAWVASQRDAAQQLYGLRSHAVLDKADSRLFEMADMLAWEWAKHVDRDEARYPLDENGVTRMRGSLRALLGDGLEKSRETNVQSFDRRGWHISGEALVRFYKRAAEFELFIDQPSDQALASIAAAVESSIRTHGPTI